ncbi:MAG: hypothetical protein O2905_04055, partial [Proteobacteria bacterium]|nr:hypothetical protein [Pseudomonadota bacterium]
MHDFRVLLATTSDRAHGDLPRWLAAATAPRITRAADTTEAANLLLTGDFDCAFVAAGPQSVDLVRELRRSGISTPVVALLAAGEGKDAAAVALRAEFLDAIAPVEATELRLSAILIAASRIPRAERRAAEAEARRAHLTLYHPVTGLPQTPLFFDRLDQG